MLTSFCKKRGLNLRMDQQNYDRIKPMWSRSKTGRQERCYDPIIDRKGKQSCDSTERDQLVPRKMSTVPGTKKQPQPHNTWQFACGCPESAYFSFHSGIFMVNWAFEKLDKNKEKRRNSI